MINFILANCRVGQKKMGVEKAPQIIYSRLLKYHNKFNKHIDIDNQVSISEHSFEINKGYKMLYDKYNDFTKKNNYPIITLGGDHSIALASCQAFIDKYKEDGHIIWIDAHVDLNTYESSASKNSHGMPVSSLMGIHGTYPIINKKYNLKPEQITYLGPRSIDKEEQMIINKYDIQLYSSKDMRNINKYDIKLYSSKDMRNTYYNCHNNLFKILDELQEKIKDKVIHISFDIDVLDPSLVKSTGTTVDKGLTIHDIYLILNNITKNNMVASCDFVEYNPNIGDIKEKERSLNYMEFSINTVINNL